MAPNGDLKAYAKGFVSQEGHERYSSLGIHHCWQLFLRPAIEALVRARTFYVQRHRTKKWGGSVTPARAVKRRTLFEKSQFLQRVEIRYHPGLGPSASWKRVRPGCWAAAGWLGLVWPSWSSSGWPPPASPWRVPIGPWRRLHA